MKYLIIIFVSLLFIFSCSEKAPVETTNGEGNVVLSFNKSDIPDSVYLIKVFLKRDGFDTITKELNPKNGSNAEVYFEEVAVGSWNLEVNAYSVNHNLLYAGEAIVNVELNKITPVFIQLHYVSGGMTGSIYIYVSWESPINVGWFDYPANPLIEGLDTFRDYKGVGEPIVIQDQLGFKMWFTGLAGDQSHIYLAVSDDGLNWRRMSEEPVISPGPETTWDSRNVFAGPVIIKDGMYLMYYCGRDKSESEYSPWHVGLATSMDGIHWEKRPDPILEGSNGEWDLKITASDVTVINDVYYMYYTGKTELNDHKIGLATSTDGINWIKYEGNPLFSESQEWEGEGYYWPSVIKYNNQYTMVYQNSYANESGFGLAYSVDGKNWKKYSDNPFFTHKETVNHWDRVLYPNFLVLDNEIRIYYTGVDPIMSIGVIRKFIQK